jgi:hypothetical protein
MTEVYAWLEGVRGAWMEACLSTHDPTVRYRRPSGAQVPEPERRDAEQGARDSDTFPCR